jgi:hypothetical protein
MCRTRALTGHQFKIAMRSINHEYRRRTVSAKKNRRISMVANELFQGRFAGKKANTMMSSEQQRRALAERGVTVVAHVMKDRELVAWAQTTGRAVYIGRNYRGWRDAGWGNPFRPQTHAPEEHDRVIGLYTRHLDDNPILLARLSELCGGKVLMCWCYPLPCHGDVLAKRANLRRPASSPANFA